MRGSRLVVYLAVLAGTVALKLADLLGASAVDAGLIGALIGSAVAYTMMSPTAR